MSLPVLFTGERRKRFVFLTANGIGQAITAIATALLVRQGFDGLVISPEALDWRALSALSLAMLGSILLTAWLRWRGIVDAEILGQDYIHALRIHLFLHITRIGADGARQMSRGALMLRFVGDLSALRNWVSLGLARLLVSGLALGLAVAVLMMIESVIGIAVAVAIAVTAMLVLFLGPRLRTRTRDARRYRGRIAALINDRIANIGVVESFGQERREIRRVRRASRRLRQALILRARTIGLIRALSDASAGFAGLAALSVGAFQVAAGVATPGTVVSAMVVAGLLAPRLTDLSRVYEYWTAAVIAREKQLQLMRLAPVGRSLEPGGEEPLTRALVPTIQLQRVEKAYLFHSVNVAIEAGERVALIGPNGSGKSTLLRIISGLVEPDRGQVLLDGESIQRCRWSDVRRTFAMVSPDLPLLRGSLRLNLTYGASNRDETAIMEVVSTCQLEELVARLDRGLDTRIAENGAGLSTGERSRIALARALMAKPSVLLLDEAEANLDAGARRTLDCAVQAFPGTVIFITHDIRQLTRADRVLAIQAGEIVSMARRDITDDPASWGLGVATQELRLVH